MNFKLHVNEKDVPTQTNYGQVNFHLAFLKKKPKLHTDCCINDHEKEISQGKYSCVSFLSHAELRLHHVIVKEVKECVCKRLSEFGGFIKHMMFCFDNYNTDDL